MAASGGKHRETVFAPSKVYVCWLTIIVCNQKNLYKYTSCFVIARNHLLKKEKIQPAKTNTYVRDRLFKIMTKA
jgi:hypothetical protein